MQFLGYLSAAVETALYVPFRGGLVTSPASQLLPEAHFKTENRDRAVCLDFREELGSKISRELGKSLIEPAKDRWTANRTHTGRSTTFVRDQPIHRSSRVGAGQYSAYPVRIRPVYCSVIWPRIQTGVQMGGMGRRLSMRPRCTRPLLAYSVGHGIWFAIGIGKVGDGDATVRRPNRPKEQSLSR